jgi:hypothetical protein
MLGSCTYSFPEVLPDTKESLSMLFHFFEFNIAHWRRIPGNQFFLT